MTPFCERKPLYELQGKNVAVDLSGWVCQAQCIADYQVQPRMYLRNLYFRTCYLLLQEVNPVFVLEGKTPTLKYKTIAARNAIQFKGAKPRAPGSSLEKGRTRFNHVLKQCEEMLKIMGLTCITGKGEAEAMCAYLNEAGLVDGCVSQDSDCFAYGANVVYRNFSISQQGVAAASGGSIDVYDIRLATKTIGFGRNKVISLAILCGSDYNEGVYGVGKDSAMKWFANVTEDEILERLRLWKKLPCPDPKKICSRCGHDGPTASHSKNGCRLCKTNKSCNVSENSIKNEIAIRSKAIQCEDFPYEDIVDEFLRRKDNVDKLDVKWSQPDMKKFIQFTTKFLQWEELYSFEKFLPILTRWILLKNVVIFQPQSIKKRRNIKGVGSFEINWDCNNLVKLIPKEQLEGVDLIKLCSTIEPDVLVARRFPNMVEEFETSKKKPVKRKAKKPAANTLDKYLNLDASCFGDEDDECDLSLIVDGIISKGLPEVVKEKLKEMKEDKERVDSFFVAPSDDAAAEDLFEASFNFITDVGGDDDDDDKDGDSDDSFDERYVPLLERLKKN